MPMLWHCASLLQAASPIRAWMGGSSSAAVFPDWGVGASPAQANPSPLNRPRQSQARRRRLVVWGDAVLMRPCSPSPAVLASAGDTIAAMSSVSPSLAALACALCLVGTAPAEPAPGCQPEAAQVLAQLNALRAAPRSCGSRVMAAVAPLGWEERLAGSARLYAQELAQRDTLTHQGQVLRSLRERLRAAPCTLR
eukprot:Opistho-2@28461